MKYGINDKVTLAVDYPLSLEPEDVIPAGKEGTVRSVVNMIEAYLVDFEKYQKHLLVPENMLE
jgi:hypothetical protein